MRIQLSEKINRAIDRGLWLAVAALLLLLAWRGVADAVTHSRYDKVAKRVAALQSPEDAKAQASKKATEDPNDPRVKQIGERNVFGPPKPKGFQGKVTAVFGDQAVFNESQLARVGESVMGAKVTAIGPNWVEVEYEGSTVRQQVFEQEGTPPDMKAALEKSK